MNINETPEHIKKLQRRAELKDAINSVIGTLLIIVILLGIPVAVIYTIVHFIIKWW